MESTIAYHARGLVDLGYPVRILAGTSSGDGSDGPLDSRIRTILHPLFGSKQPDILRIKAELDRGNVPSDFDSLTADVLDALRDSLADSDICIVHNALSLHKNLPLTAALARLDGGRVNSTWLVGWCHDLAWTNEQYLPELHEGYPWDLLRRPWPGVRYVTVSEMRRAELAELMGIPPESIAVISGGVDPARFFQWTPMMQTLEDELCLLDADGLLLLPARLTRRKNIALALHILAEVRRQSGRDFRLILTGPPGPHNPSNRSYLDELLALRCKLSLDDSAHFIYTYGVPDDETMANLFQAADALLFPSLQEGFGIPVLEAGLASLPVFCADIPPLRETGQEDVTYFDPVHASPAEVAAQIIARLDADPVYRLRSRVQRSYRWDTLIRKRLVPLLEAL